MRKLVLLLGIMLLVQLSKAQPFVDVLNINHQRMATRTESDSFTNVFNNTFFGILLPIKLDTNNIFISRANIEMLNSDVSGHGLSASVKLKSLLIGFGWQHHFNKKWGFNMQLLPKITSDFEDKINSKDFQMGGTFILMYKKKKNFRYKAGVYYNREPFGNFFTPLLGADIQLNERNWIYGQLPLYFRYEHKFTEKLYSGIGVRIFGRSFRLNSALNNNYVFLQENQIKLFADYYVKKKIVVYGEVGRTLGYGLRHYKDNTDRTGRMQYPTQLASVKDGFYINAGIAYRVRNDF